MVQVDINCDIGEGFGSDILEGQNELLKYVTSANIACGFHAGNPSIMRETVEQALYHGVKIGAHPGLPDLQGFGRRNMAISPQEAYDMVVYQVGALQGFLSTKNEVLQHVKPHGALYNMAANDPQLAQAIARAVYDISPDLILFGLAESALTKAGEMIGLQTAHEVFADRTYQQEGLLTARTEPNALITDRDISLKQVVQMVTRGTVKTVQGVDIPIRAHTVCIHGDGEHALSFARYINRSLQKYEVTIEAINK